MGWSGRISAWAFRKQAAIVREHNRKEEEDYLKELKRNYDWFIFYWYGSHAHWCVNCMVGD